MGLSYGVLGRGGNLQLNAYSVADLAEEPIDRCSTTGYYVFLGSTPILWCAKRQSIVAKSSTEVEYRSLAHTSVELSWLRQLSKDLRIFLPTRRLIWCDNISAISLASNLVFPAQTKHVEVDYHFVREKVLRKDLEIRYISAHDQIGDIFTKGLHPKRFQFSNPSYWSLTSPTA